MAVGNINVGGSRVGGSGTDVSGAAAAIPSPLTGIGNAFARITKKPLERPPIGPLDSPRQRFMAKRRAGRRDPDRILSEARNEICRPVIDRR